MNLKKMTAQQVFDVVAEHLLRQGKKSVDCEDNECLYRSPEGLKCAAGVLIDDADYTHDLEHKCWLELLERNYLPANKYDAHRWLINELQNIHDYDLPENWAEALKKLALSQGLHFSQPVV